MSKDEAIKTLKENCCAMCAYCSKDMDSCDISGCDNKDAIKVLEQEPCFEGMTNGEVIQTIFPECDVCDPIIEDNIIHVCFKDNPTALDAFTYTWWNAPYEGRKMNDYIELVINVPKNLVYEGFDRHFTEEEKDVLIKAIGNAKPLPQGHGRLIDADAVLEEPFGNTYKDLDIAETIIEADNAESE